MFLKKYIPFKSCLESRYVPTETNDEIEQVRESVIKYTCQLESFIDQFQQEKEANRKLVDHYFTKALAAKNDNDHIEYHHNVTSYLISKKNVQYYNTMITTALEESSRSQQLYQVTAAKLTAKKFTINNDFTKTLGDNNQVMTDNKALEEYSASIKESLEKIINTEKPVGEKVNDMMLDDAFNQEMSRRFPNSVQTLPTTKEMQVAPTIKNRQKLEATD